MTSGGAWPPLFVGLFAPGKQSKEFKIASSLLRGLFRGKELLNSQLHFWGIIIWLQNQPLLEQLSGSARSLSLPSVQPGLQRFLRAANTENYLTKRDGRQLCTALFAQKCNPSAHRMQKQTEKTTRTMEICFALFQHQAMLNYEQHTPKFCVSAHQKPTDDGRQMLPDEPRISGLVLSDLVLTCCFHRGSKPGIQKPHQEFWHDAYQSKWMCVNRFWQKSDYLCYINHGISWLFLSISLKYIDISI